MLVSCSQINDMKEQDVFRVQSIQQEYERALLSRGTRVLQVFMSEPSCPATGRSGIRFVDLDDTVSPEVDARIIDTSETFPLNGLRLVIRDRTGVMFKTPESKIECEAFYRLINMPFDLFYSNARHGEEPLSYIGRFFPGNDFEATYGHRYG